MKINKSKKNNIHSGDILGCESAEDGTDYYLVSRISDNKYALVILGTTDNSCSDWPDNGNLTVNGGDTLSSTEDFVNSTEELIKGLCSRYDYIHKVDATLNIFE